MEGREMSKVNELFYHIREARDNMVKRNETEESATENKEEEKERIVRNLVKAATER